MQLLAAILCVLQLVAANAQCPPESVYPHFVPPNLAIGYQDPMVTPMPEPRGLRFHRRAVSSFLGYTYYSSGSYRPVYCSSGYSRTFSSNYFGCCRVSDCIFRTACRSGTLYYAGTARRTCNAGYSCATDSWVINSGASRTYYLPVCAATGGDFIYGTAPTRKTPKPSTLAPPPSVTRTITESSIDTVTDTATLVQELPPATLTETVRVDVTISGDAGTSVITSATVVVVSASSGGIATSTVGIGVVDAGSNDGDPIPSPKPTEGKESAMTKIIGGAVGGGIGVVALSLISLVMCCRLKVKHKAKTVHEHEHEKVSNLSSTPISPASPMPTYNGLATSLPQQGYFAPTPPAFKYAGGGVPGAEGVGMYAHQYQQQQQQSHHAAGSTADSHASRLSISSVSQSHPPSYHSGGGYAGREQPRPGQVSPSPSSPVHGRSNSAGRNSSVGMQHYVEAPGWDTRSPAPKTPFEMPTGGMSPPLRMGTRAELDPRQVGGAGWQGGGGGCVH